MTAKDQVLVIYPNARLCRINRVADNTKPNEFSIEVLIDTPNEKRLAIISTSFCSPQIIEEFVWELAWQNIQNEMLEKLAQDPMDLQSLEEERLREELEHEFLMQERRDWERRMMEREWELHCSDGSL